MPKTKSYGQLVSDFDPAFLLLNIGAGGYYTTQNNATCTIAMATAAVTVNSSLRYGSLRLEGSFSADPAAAAALIVKDYAGTTVWSVDITKGGPWVFDLDERLLSVGTGYLVTLGASGTGGVNGKLNVAPKIYGNTP